MVPSGKGQLAAAIAEAFQTDGELIERWGNFDRGKSFTFDELASALENLNTDVVVFLAHLPNVLIETSSTLEGDGYNKINHIPSKSEGDMALVNQNYVIADTDNPLEAYIEGKTHKTYLVANLAFNDSPEGSASHYNLSLAEIYSAMAFYCANEEEIESSLKEAHEGLLKLGMRDGDEVLAKIRARQKK